MCPAVSVCVCIVCLPHLSIASVCMHGSAWASACPVCACVAACVPAPGRGRGRAWFSWELLPCAPAAAAPSRLCPMAHLDTTRLGPLAGGLSPGHLSPSFFPCLPCPPPVLPSFASSVNLSQPGLGSQRGSPPIPTSLPCHTLLQGSWGGLLWLLESIATRAPSGRAPPSLTPPRTGIRAPSSS